MSQTNAASPPQHAPGFCSGAEARPGGEKTHHIGGEFAGKRVRRSPRRSKARLPAAARPGTRPRRGLMPGESKQGEGRRISRGEGGRGNVGLRCAFFFPGTPLVSARGTVTIARQPPLGTWPSVALGLSALTTSGAATAAAACGSRRARRRTSSLPARSMPRRAARAGAPRSLRGARSRRFPRDEVLGGGGASAHGEAPYTYQKQQISFQGPFGALVGVWVRGRGQGLDEGGCSRLGGATADWAEPRPLEVSHGRCHAVRASGQTAARSARLLATWRVPAVWGCGHAVGEYRRVITPFDGT